MPANFIDGHIWQSLHILCRQPPMCHHLLDYPNPPRGRYSGRQFCVKISPVFKGYLLSSYFIIYAQSSQRKSYILCVYICMPESSFCWCIWHLYYIQCFIYFYSSQTRPLYMYARVIILLIHVWSSETLNPNYDI